MTTNIINGHYTPNGFTTRPSPPKPQEAEPLKKINLDAFTWDGDVLDRINTAIEGTKDHGVDE